jgi:hypothetical protein
MTLFNQKTRNELINFNRRSYFEQILLLINDGLDEKAIDVIYKTRHRRNREIATNLRSVQLVRKPNCELSLIEKNRIVEAPRQV